MQESRLEQKHQYISYVRAAQTWHRLPGEQDQVHGLRGLWNPTGLWAQKVLHLIQCSVAATLKCLIIFAHGALNFCLALGSSSYVADPAGETVVLNLGEL